MGLRVIRPDWPAPANVHAFTTTRKGGYSRGPWSSLNLGAHCGDSPQAVENNRAALNRLLPAPPQWLRQVHGVQVVDHPGVPEADIEADAITTKNAGQVCAVLTADCLPVFFTDVQGAQVAVAHAGWRGLAGGMLQNVIRSMEGKPHDLIAWLGPAIGPQAYEVGDDVKSAFGRTFSPCFSPSGDRWLLNLYSAARIILGEAGMSSIHGGDFCTFSESDLFYSYRRDGQSGRMASVIWLD